MADWEVIKIPKRGYGATKEYRWRQFLLQKGEESNEGWYLKDVNRNKEYNHVQDFMDNVRNEPLTLAEEMDKINLWRIMLQEVAESNETAWAKAKTPVWSAWERKDRPPSDSTATDNVLFRDGKANQGFRKAKDAMKVAEWFVFSEGNWTWGIVNHTFILNSESKTELDEGIHGEGFSGLEPLFG